MTKQFIYHPEVIDPGGFTLDWYKERRQKLFELSEGSPVDFGWDRQYDRTVDENGDPGEYVQVWMEVHDD